MTPDQARALFATVHQALAAEWEEQRRSFNGATYRQCLHCQGTTARGHDADCVGERARAAARELEAEMIDTMNALEAWNATV